MGRGSSKHSPKTNEQASSVKLWLDDKLDEAEYRKTPAGWTGVKTVAAAKELLLEGNVICASLDHDLGDADELTGYDLVKWMCEFNIWPAGGISIHSDNSVGVKNMSQSIERYAPYGRPSPDRRHFGTRAGR
jgi:hypothetical protein